jgi:hypothetical protein
MNETWQRSRKTKPIRRRQLGAGVAIPCVLGLAAAGPAHAHEVAQDTATAVDVVSEQDLEALPSRSVDDILKTMVTDGKIHLNIRGRAEIADQDTKETSQAYTVRTRLGFTTGEYNGLSFHIDMEDIRSADNSLYNAAGTSGQPDKTVIADVEDTELNQLWANYKLQDADLYTRVGRQRIKLDDDRFIGNVGWRQNEQTFDAVKLDLMPTEQLDVNYAYIWDVNRIFGPDADRDFESDSHLIRVSYNDQPLGRVTGFAYLLDLDDEATADANSSNTFGIRYEATRDLKGDPEGPRINYIFSYAFQTDTGDNPNDYDADYFLGEVKYIENGWYFGGGYELLGSDSGDFAFRTPLATGHKFNGYADVFLTTPDDGLEDIYIYLGGDLPDGWKAKAAYHWFDPDTGSRDFGQEIDAVLSKKLSNNFDVLFKYAYYDGKGSFDDIRRFWAQLTFVY